MWSLAWYHESGRCIKPRLASARLAHIWHNTNVKVYYNSKGLILILTLNAPINHHNNYWPHSFPAPGYFSRLVVDLLFLVNDQNVATNWNVYLFIHLWKRWVVACVSLKWNFYILTLDHKKTIIDVPMRRKSFESIVRKWQNAGKCNQHFLLFMQFAFPSEGHDCFMLRVIFGLQNIFKSLQC